MLLGALVVALLWPSLIGGNVLSNGDVIFGVAPWSAQKPAGFTHPSNPGIDDQTYEFDPDLIVTRRALAHGQLGLWNPYQGAGRPLLASVQHAPLFPPQWLSLVLPFWQSLVFVAALKLALAALGLYLLARFCGLSRGAALLSATAYAFSAYQISWLQSPLGNSVAMCPWVMLTVGRTARWGGLLNGLGLTVALAALLLGGHPETIIFTLVATAIWGVWELAAANRAELLRSEGARGVSLIRRGALMVGAAILGLGLAAIVVIPFVELLTLSPGTSRSGGPYGNNILYAFALPELWGNPSKAIGDFGPINYSVRTGYLGALPMLLAVGGVVARRPRRVHLFWIVFTVFALLVAMHTPLHTLLGELPGVKRTNLLSALFLVVLGGSLLAGFGLQRWLDGDVRSRRRMLIAIAATALVPAVVLLRSTSPFSHLRDALGQLPSLSHGLTSKTFIKQAVAWRWLIFGASGLLALSLVRWRLRELALVAAVLIVGVDLVTLDHGFQPSVPLSHVDPPTPPALKYLQAHQGTQRISGAFNGPPSEPALLPSLAERYDLADVQSYDLPKPDRWQHLWNGLGQTPGDLSYWNPSSPRAHQVLDMFAARYVLLPRGAEAPPWLKPVFQNGSEIVAEDPTALPRAWVAYSWRAARGDKQALAWTLGSPTPQLLREPVIEGVPSPSASTPGGFSPARVVVNENEHLVIRVDAKRDGYLVLDDSYYPGWQAEVDGRTSPVIPANETFRAVRVRAGRHLVGFRYRPISAVIGAALTLLSGAAVLVLLIAGIRSGRRRARPLL